MVARRSLTATAMAVLTALTIATPATSGQRSGPTVATASQQTASPMRELFAALTELLPYSLDTAGWQDPDNATLIETRLADFADRAAAVQSHGLGLNRSYDRARDTLASDTAEALNSYRRGDKTISRHLIRNVTESCFACHSRLPASEPTDLGAALVAAIDIDQVEPADRLRLLVATRQFSSAMTMAEAMLDDPDYGAADIDLLGVFESYLKVAIRVSRDYERPRATLWRFMQRDDLSLYLADRVGDWIAALEEFSQNPTPVALQTATDLLREANNRNEYVRDRRGLIHAMVASGILHQFVQTAPDDQLALAEAYYRLGIAEAAISRTVWVPETEYFLETAIRVAPQSSHARNAYIFLEQYVLASYTGSAGTKLPDDVWDRLMQLRTLVEQRP